MNILVARDAYMPILRAIENGFSFVRHGGPGFSVANDNRGRIISSMDYFKSDEQVMDADVPIQQANTIYAQVGDIFTWLYIAGIVI